MDSRVSLCMKMMLVIVLAGIGVSQARLPPGSTSNSNSSSSPNLTLALHPPLKSKSELSGFNRPSPEGSTPRSLLLRDPNPDGSLSKEEEEAECDALCECRCADLGRYSRSYYMRVAYFRRVERMMPKRTPTLWGFVWETSYLSAGVCCIIYAFLYAMRKFGWHVELEMHPNAKCPRVRLKRD